MSSMIASARSSTRSAAGTRLPSSVRIPTANAMSVAIGTPQPWCVSLDVLKER